MAEQGSGGAADRPQPDDPFEGLILDESFVRGASIHEPSPPVPPPPDRSDGTDAADGGSGSPFGEWVRRFAALLVLGAMALIVVVAGALGYGPLREVNALRRLGGTDETAAPPTDDPPESTIESTTTTVDPTLAGLDFRPGQCVTWDQSVDVERLQAPRAIDCELPHLVEIAGRFEAGVAAGDRGPSVSQWDDERDDHCRTMVESYLDEGLDPLGRFSPGLITPTAEQWRNGERTAYCGVVVRPPGSSSTDPLTLFAVSARGADQQFLDEVGTCFAGLSEDDRGPAVPCVQRHTMEVTGPVDLSAVPAYPAPDGWAAVVGDKCTKLAELLYGDVLPPAVRGEWITIPPESWATGRRTLECTLVKRGADGLLLFETIPLRR